MTEIKNYKEKPLMVVIRFNRLLRIEEIKSVYSRKNDKVYKDWEKEGLLLYKKNIDCNSLGRVFLGTIPNSPNKLQSKPNSELQSGVVPERRTTTARDKSTKKIELSKENEKKFENKFEKETDFVEIELRPTTDEKPKTVENKTEKPTNKTLKKPDSMFYNISLLDHTLNTSERIVLNGDLGKFLGYVERYEYSILLRGDKGAGKTRLLFQMMNLFATQGFKVGCFSLEIGRASNLLRDMRNEYIQPNAVHNVSIADECPNGLADIEKATDYFDVICIDSWGKIGNTKADDFNYLRKKYPKTMFIVIFQSTTNKTARGGSMPEYDAGVVIQVHNGGIAICEKNRYNGEQYEYSVFDRKLIDDTTI